MLPRLVHLDEFLVVLLLCLFFFLDGGSDNGSGSKVSSGGVSSIEGGTRWVREAVARWVHAVALCVDHAGGGKCSGDGGFVVDRLDSGDGRGDGGAGGGRDEDDGWGVHFCGCVGWVGFGRCVVVLVNWFGEGSLQFLSGLALCEVR